MAPICSTDFRKWSYAERKKLLKGERVRIRAGAPIIMYTAKFLLMATSTTMNQLIKYNILALPDDVDKDYPDPYHGVSSLSYRLGKSVHYCSVQFDKV
jgi:hypothetical protein